MENNNTNVAETTQNTQTQTFDYESEYKKMLAERDSYKAEAEKQKSLKDKYASENADYKKKEIDKMSAEEKSAKELQELIESNKKYQEQIARFELEKSCTDEGFSADETKKLVESKFSPKVIAEIYAERLKQAQKTFVAETIKNSTPSTPIGNGTGDGSQDKSGFQKFQESQKQQNSRVEI